MEQGLVSISDSSGLPRTRVGSRGGFGNPDEVMNNLSQGLAEQRVCKRDTPQECEKRCEELERELDAAKRELERKRQN